MSLKIRRGTDAERLTITPLLGEPIYATDTQLMYIGDGVTIGGILVTGSGATFHSQLGLDDGTNPHGTTKSDVGLGNVDNTSDLNKPISTATQTALDGKQDALVSGTNIKTINGSTLLGSGDLVITSGTAASVSEINTGTDNDKFASSLGLQGSKYLDQTSSKVSATASGTDTYTATLSPAITAYVATGVYYIKFTNANTGACTLNLNGLGAKAITKNAGEALTLGDIKAGKIFAVAYDGTEFQMLGRVGRDASLYLHGDDAAFIPGGAGSFGTYAYVGGLVTSTHVGSGANQVATRVFQFKLPKDFVGFESVLIGSYRFGATDSMTASLIKAPAFPFLASATGTTDATLNGVNILPVANDTHVIFTFTPTSSYSAGDTVAIEVTSQVDNGEYAEISFVELKYYAN